MATALTSSIAVSSASLCFALMVDASRTQPECVVYLLDYSGPDGFPQQLARHVSNVVVLDHHKTAAAQLADSSSHPPNLHVHLDMQRSGAAIARDFFSPPGMSEQLQHMFRWGASLI
jgi:oligoribonuclease NrnB/cAMP/cGMP phosphodiesterase (DHH superfamily)